MIRLYWSLLIAFFVATATHAVAAHQLAHRVVVLGPSAEHETVVRVREELLLLGFSVQFLSAVPADVELAAIGRKLGAAAVARVEAWPPEIIIWVDPASSATGARSVDEIHVSDSLTEPPESELLAVRAVELLRGSLLPVPHVESPTAAEDLATAPSSVPAGGRQGAATAAPSSSEASPGATGLPAPSGEATPDRPGGESHGAAVQLGPALLLSPGGVPATPHVLLGGEVHVVWRLAVDALLLIPTTAATVSADEGRMSLRTMVLAGGVTFGLTEPDSAWLARAGLGLGAAAMFYSGQADEPFIARDDTAWAAAPYGTVGVGYRVHSIVALRADGFVAVLQPEPVLRIAGQEAATFGQPAIVVGVGIEVRP